VTVKQMISELIKCLDIWKWPLPLTIMPNGKRVGGRAVSITS
jgi:hypothetical protein